MQESQATGGRNSFSKINSRGGVIGEGKENFQKLKKSSCITVTRGYVAPMSKNKIPQNLIKAHAESSAMFNAMREAKTSKDRKLATVRYQNANAKYHDLLFAFVEVDGKPDQSKYNETVNVLNGWA